MYKPPGTVTGLYREDANLTYAGVQFNPYHDVYRENKPAQSSTGLPADTNDSYEGSVRFPRGVGAVGSGGQDSKVPGGGGTVYPNNPRAYRRNVFSYNTWSTGASQGASGNTGSSTRPLDNAARLAKTQAAMGTTGVVGPSVLVLWEKVEPFPPVNGFHTYNSSIFDLALAEIGQYLGGQLGFYVNGGDAGSATWLQGGGTSVLAATPATGQKVFNLAGRSLTDGSLPLVGASVLLTGEPDQEEGSVVTASDPATGNVTLTSNITGSHLVGTTVEWTKVPAAFQAVHAYVPGDIIIAPTGGVNAMGVAADGFLYCVTQPYTSGASFWPIQSTLCELIVGNDGSLMPAPWDANMLLARKALVAWLGARYDGDPRVGLAHCTGGGRVGEVGIDLGTNPAAADRVSSWLSHGLTDWALIDVWKQIIDANVTAWPTTPKCFHTGEPFGQNMTWPTLISLGSCTTNGTASLVCGSTAGAVAGMLIYGHADVQNLYVGTVVDGTHINLASDQQGTAAVARGSHAGITLQCNSTSRAVTFTLSTNDEATTVVTVTDGSLALADQGKLITGSSFSARRYVGPIGGTTLGTSLGLSVGQFLPSTSRIGYTAPATHAIAATTLTLAFDGLNYSTLDAVGGIVTQAISGKNSGGALTSDVYSGGTPVAGYLAGKGFAVQQNGLAASDLNSLPLGRFRQVISGASANAAGNPNATLRLRGGGYQEVATGASLQNITDELDVATDDDVLYVEVYGTNIATAAATVVPNFANGIRP